MANNTYKALRQDWRGTTKTTKGGNKPGPGWRGTAPTGPSTRIGEGPPHDTRQQAQARDGRELHPLGPPPGHRGTINPTKGSSRPQPGMQGDNIPKHTRLGPLQEMGAKTTTYTYEAQSRATKVGAQAMSVPKCTHGNPNPSAHGTLPSHRRQGSGENQSQMHAQHNSRKRSIHSPGTEAALAMQMIRPNVTQSP